MLRVGKGDVGRAAALYSAVVEQAPIPVVVYRWEEPPALESFRLLIQNEAAVRGGSPREDLGRRLDEIRSPLLDSPVPARYAQVLTSGEAMEWSIDWPLQGRTVSFAVKCFPLDAEHVAVFFEDVSEIRRAQAQLAEKVRELERSNHDLDDFAYVASHDLKSPLRDIQNLASWVAEDLGSALEEPTSRHLSVLRQRIGRMERLLDDLLAYSRAARTPPAPETLSLRACVDEVVAFLAPARHQIVLRGTTDTVVATPVGFALVLRNLISNAIKHDDRPGGVIVVEAEATADGVRVEVRDDGPGIPPEFHERVFRMFHTLRPRDEVDASGMGLAIVKKVVESHGGAVSVESAGRGTAIRTVWASKELTP